MAAGRGGAKLSEEALRERLLAKVLIPSDPDECWVWKGAVSASGRAHMQADRRGSYSNASRIAYRVLVGPIPEGQWVLHTCDNALCCNPKHLYLGDHKRNMQDVADRGRQAGERHPSAKLTAEQVDQIRASTERSRVLADRYDISMSHVAHIRKGDYWKER